MISPSYRGLSSMEAEVRQKEYGKNIRPQLKRKNPFKRLWSIISQPMLLILSATAVIYYFIGTKTETIILALSIIPVVMIEFFQERRTDKAIELLDKMMIEECQIYRDGVLIKLPSSEVVPGDLLYLCAGNKIPADGVLVRSPGLMVDEAILTGESVPVVKSQCDQHLKGAERLFQGTMVVQGEGQMVALATGGDTNYGKLGNLLEGIADEPTPLQSKIDKLVKQVATGAIIVALFVGFVLGQQQGLVKGILGTLTIAMAIIPEEFPIVFSVFLIMGVWRLSKRKALARKMVMVETLGSATVICTDKTGTLTEGKMSLERVYVNGKLFDVKNEANFPVISPLIEAAVLAMEKIAVDPMEIEMQRFARDTRIINDNFYSVFQLQKDSTFNAATKLVNHIWKGSGGKVHQYTAGAPESVVDLCVWKGKEKQDVVNTYQQLALDGYRVVGIAKTAISSDDFQNKDLEFAGLIAMSDPPRAGVKEAMDVCKRAGVRVIMITGDHALTAKAIAAQIGLDSGGEIVTGSELDDYSQDKLHELIKERNIFARIRPEQKYMIVEALQANEEIVAMTGDGVNDAPALKKANIGIAMGHKGTDVARAASGIVLLDDNFATIVKAIEEGRRIYDNLRKAFLFLFSFHLPIIGLAIIPLLLGQGLYFLPIHVIFLEFFGDPTTVIGLERDPVSPKSMSEPPRPITEPFVNRQLWWRIGWQAAGILGLSLAFYGYGLWNGSIILGRTMSFLSLVVAQVILVLINRDWVQVKSNHVLSLLLMFTLLILHVALFLPEARVLFHFVEMSWSEYGYTLLAALLSMLFFNKIAKGA